MVVDWDPTNQALDALEINNVKFASGRVEVDVKGLQEGIGWIELAGMNNGEDDCFGLLNAKAKAGCFEPDPHQPFELAVVHHLLELGVLSVSCVSIHQDFVLHPF